MTNNNNPIISSDIYDLTQAAIDIKNKFINEENPDTLTMGLYGYLSEMSAHMLQNAVVVAAEYSNEAIPTKAKFEKNIITHALSLGINKIFATPATMKIMLCFPRDILDNHMDINNNTFVFSKNIPIYIGDYEFHTDYDIRIDRNIFNNIKKDSSIYTAKYIIDRENPISNITNPYLPPIVVLKNDNITDLLVLTCIIRQVEFTQQHKKILTDNPIENKTFTFSFEGQMSTFNVEVVENGETHYLTPIYEGLQGQDENIEYCYYTFLNSNTIRIKFNRDSYEPVINSELTVNIYTSQGTGGNFEYSEDIRLELPTDDYGNMYVIIKNITNSINGIDKKSIADLKKIIPKEALSRGSIINTKDLQNFFNSIDNENCKVYFFKKRDNQLERLYYSYILLKDDDNTIIPTNTCDIIIKDSEFENIDNGYTDIIVIKPGTKFYLPKSDFYTGKQSRTYVTSIDSIDLKKEICDTIGYRNKYELTDDYKNNYNKYLALYPNTTKESFRNTETYKIAFEYFKKNNIYFATESELINSELFRREYTKVLGSRCSTIEELFNTSYFIDIYTKYISSVGKFENEESFINSIKFNDEYKKYISIHYNLYKNDRNNSIYDYPLYSSKTDLIEDVDNIYFGLKYQAYLVSNNKFESEESFKNSIDYNTLVEEFKSTYDGPEYDLESACIDFYVYTKEEFLYDNPELTNAIFYKDKYRLVGEYKQFIDPNSDNYVILTKYDYINIENTVYAENKPLWLYTIDDFKNTEKYQELTKYIYTPTDEDIKEYTVDDNYFVYCTPFLTVLNKNPLYTSYFLTSFNTRKYLEFAEINQNSKIQFISSYVDWGRKFFGYDGAGSSDSYDLDLEILQNISEKSIEFDPNGIVPYLKVFLVFYSSNNEPIFYSDGLYQEYSDSNSNYIFKYRFSLFTDDYFTNDNRIRITNGLKEIGTDYSVSYADFTSNMKASIFIFTPTTEDVKETNQEISKIFPKSKLKDDKYNYILSNKYDIEEGLDFFYNYTHIVSSPISISEEVDYNGNTDIKYKVSKVPLIRDSYINSEERIQSVINEIELRRKYIEMSLYNLEDSFGIDIKFFNTYGPTNLYYVDKDRKLTSTNLTMKFKIKTLATADKNIIDNIIADIKNYMEDLNEITDLHIPNLITEITTKYRESIIYFEFLDCNGYGPGYQHFYRPVEYIDHTVPEFLSIENDMNTDLPKIEIITD